MKKIAETHGKVFEKVVDSAKTAPLEQSMAANWAIGFVHRR
jgi:hypothetical protein